MRYNEKLREYRKNLGLKQSEVAEQIFVQPRAISLWEQGKNAPGMELLIDLAKLYNVSLDELLSEELAEEKIAPVNAQGVFMEMPFSEKLRMMREQLRLSREKMAEDLDISDTAIYRWESGQQMPSIPMIVKLSRFLGMPIDELLYAELKD